MDDLIEQLRQMRNDTSCYPAVCDDAIAEILYLRRDAARYRWLKDRVFGADFSYGDGDESFCALVFKIPDDMQVSGDLDRTLDAAMKG